MRPSGLWLLAFWQLASHAVEPSVPLQRSNVSIPSGLGSVAASVITADPLRVSFAVLYARDYRTPGDDVPTLRELAERKELTPTRGRAQALLTGGSAGYRLDTPLGLVIATGRIKSTLYTAKKTGSCAIPNVRQSQFRQSAVLCRRNDSAQPLTILYSDDVAAQDRGAKPACEQAIQAGPFLVDQGTVAVCTNANENVLRRHAVCIGRRAIHFVQTDAPIGLHALAVWLRKSFGCQQAALLGSEPHVGHAFTSSTGQTIYDGQAQSEHPSFVLLK